MVMENTIRIIKRIEKTHRNLGLPTVFCKLIDISNLGVLIVAERGRGKGAIMDSLIQLRHRNVMRMSKITPAGLAAVANEMNDTEITIINPDITSLYTDYLKDAAINVISHLISEHSLPASWTARYRYSISNCTVSFISGVQAKMMRKLMKLASWESMYKDRFIRFYMFYPRGTPKYCPEYPYVGEIEMGGHPVDAISIPSSIKSDPRYTRMKAILRIQTSEGRCQMYLNRILKASAWLNQREVVTEGDLKFLNACALYLHTEYMLSERETVSSPLLLNPDSFVLLFHMIEHKEASKKSMREYFKMSTSKLDRQLKPLMSANIIKGTFGKDLLRLNPKFKKKYVDPILELYEEYGVE